MRYSRQNKILDIISHQEVETQERLALILKEEGFDVTQATVSRDIKELQLVKVISSTGKHKYAQSTSVEQPVSDRFVKIFKETIRSVDVAYNIIVVKTLTGCANAACEAIDSLILPHIIGSIAGDNTIMIVVDHLDNVDGLMKEFEKLLD